MVTIVRITMQDKYKTVAEALQAAVVSLLAEEKMSYRRSFYYWAAFISHGFASVLLDDALLGQIHARLDKLRQDCSDKQGDGGDGKSTLEMDMMVLTRDAYSRLEDMEQTLSREWCEM